MTIGRVPAPGGDRKPDAFTRQDAGYAGSDAGARTCDQTHFAVELQIHVLFSVGFGWAVRIGSRDRHP